MAQVEAQTVGVQIPALPKLILPPAVLTPRPGTWLLNIYSKTWHPLAEVGGHIVTV